MVNWLVAAATLLCTLLAVIDIQRPSYWVDEKVSVDIASAATPQQVIANVIQSERRPPAYHLLLWAWTRLVSMNERTARLFSVLWAILLVPATYQLTRQFATPRAAVLASYLSAIAPIVISYGQIIRYYSMVAALSALSFALFFAVMRRPRGRKPWVLYAAVTLLLLYTDYPSYGVVVAQNLITIWWWIHPERAPHHPRWRWFGMQAIMAMLAVLWLPVVLMQGTRNFGVADLSSTASGAILRIIYPFYAWITGETIFPWTVFGFLGAVVGGVLVIVGLIKLTHASREAWILAFAPPFIVAQILLGTVAEDSPFVNAPARSMACAGLLFTLEGVGLSAVSVDRRWLADASAGVVVVSHAIALSNDYRGVDYINTVYNTPAREVGEAIGAEARPGDAVVTASDSMVEFYLPTDLRDSSFYPNQVQRIHSYLATHQHANVWQVIMGRDRTRNDVSAKLAEWLKSQYTLESSQGFAEQSVTYRAVKTRLIGRKAYRYRLVLYHYVPTTQPQK